MYTEYWLSITNWAIYITGAFLDVFLEAAFVFISRFCCMASTSESIVSQHLYWRHFLTLRKGEHHGKDDTQVAVGRREGQVVFQLERSLYYCQKSVYC